MMPLCRVITTYAFVASQVPFPREAGRTRTRDTVDVPLEETSRGLSTYENVGSSLVRADRTFVEVPR